DAPISIAASAAQSALSSPLMSEISPSVNAGPVTSQFGRTVTTTGFSVGAVLNAGATADAFGVRDGALGRALELIPWFGPDRPRTAWECADVPAIRKIAIPRFCSAAGQRRSRSGKASS